MATSPAPSEDAHRRAGEARRITWIGLGINMVLIAIKLAGGILGHSQAVVADAFHSLSDGTTDIAVLVGVGYWSKPPDRGHPHGHGRIETLVTTGIGAALCAVAAGIAYGAITTISVYHARPPGYVAMGAALLSIVSKEVLYRWTVRVGRRIESSAVVANAWHHRSDAFSSIPVLIAVVAIRIHPAWFFLDHLGAVAVSVFIFRTGVLVAWPALKELVDAAAPARDLENIRRIALATAGVKEVHAIRTRSSGGALQVDLHVLVDGEMSVRRGHDLAEEVERRLVSEAPRLTDVVVHIEPYEPRASG
jgi:cation diffusion facilitator family transporter